MNKRVRVNLRENNSGVNADVTVEYSTTEPSETIKNDEVAEETHALLEQAQNRLFKQKHDKAGTSKTPWRE